MNFKQTKHELQNIISGKSSSSHDALIQTIASYLRSGKRASPVAKEKHQDKTEETKRLIQFAKKHQLLLNSIDETKFISSGAEQKVYIKDDKHVIKLNDAIYYASWEDYCHNLLFNNYFFADTAYDFQGFFKNGETLFAVVEQNFVKADALTNLNSVQKFLSNNGFVNTRNNDYYNPDLGIILEDLHDENVLTKQNLLYFIDTVFYIKPNVFWQ
jgi:hypothetical protein